MKKVISHLVAVAMLLLVGQVFAFADVIYPFDPTSPAPAGINWPPILLAVVALAVIIVSLALQKSRRKSVSDKNKANIRASEADAVDEREEEPAAPEQEKETDSKP